MSRHRFVHIVCSPRTRIGKTLMSRLLVDYFLLQDRQPIGFETNVNEPGFLELFPQRVISADIRSVQGQVTLFDGLLVDDDAPKVVDVWHRVFDKLFELFEAIDFVDEARARGVEPLIYFIDDPDPLTEAAHARLRARFPDLRVTSVRNEAATGVSAVTGPRSGAPAKFLDEPRLQIPPLDPILRRVIDIPGLSLAAFLRGSPMADVSIVVRAAVRAWTSKIFVQLQDFELRHSMAGAEYLK